MRLVSALLQALAITASAATAHAADNGDRALIEHGRYLVQTAGCNDCHTPGYAAAGGRVSEKDWLTGDRVGWSGPWGTTYATNLRLHPIHRPGR